MSERRRQERYPSENGRGPGAGRFLQLCDISPGGMAIIYDAREGLLNETFELGSLFSGEEWLNEIPFQIVSDRPLESPDASGRELRRLSIGFVNLNGDQEELLEFFLWSHTTL